MIKAIKYLTLCLAVVFAYSADAQNLAGTEISTNVGEPDVTLVCDKETGTTGGQRFTITIETKLCKREIRKKKKKDV